MQNHSRKQFMLFSTKSRDCATHSPGDSLAGFGHKPRLLDLFCCAGGAGTGYNQAGFDIVGVDIVPQRNYPYPFIQANALEMDLAFIKPRCDPRFSSMPVLLRFSEAERKRGCMAAAYRARQRKARQIESPIRHRKCRGSPLNPVVLSEPCSRVFVYCDIDSSKQTFRF